jgi:RNA polymerase sigma-70 factor (ECF subfamily)
MENRIKGFSCLYPYSGVDLPAAADLPRTGERLDFSLVYEAWFDPCLRWLRALGIPDAELEDAGQEVFVVVHRKLASFDGDKLPAWLYRIAANTASDHRRRAWFRRLWARAWSDTDELVCRRERPDEQAERRDEERQLMRLLGRMSEKRRVAFCLFELEGYSGEEIALLLDVPQKTIWSRLHQARKEFLALVEKMREAG